MNRNSPFGSVTAPLSGSQRRIVQDDAHPGEGVPVLVHDESLHRPGDLLRPDLVRSRRHGQEEDQEEGDDAVPPVENAILPSATRPRRRESLRNRGKREPAPSQKAPEALIGRRCSAGVSRQARLLAWRAVLPPEGFLARFLDEGGVQRWRARSRVRLRGTPPLRLQQRPLERGAMSGIRSVEQPPEAFTTRCQGTPRGLPCIAHPTARGERRLPRRVAIWP